MSEIVVGYDGSDSAKAALDQAIALAKELGDTILIVFGFAPGGYGGGEVPTQRRAVKELGEKVTGEGATRVAEAGVEHAVELLNEHGPDALSDIADRCDARMIVVGTKGESPLKGAILASTAHRLLQIANRPVLVVRRESA
jgi:nucleotide-binding universal stress UspA family protein